MGSFSDYAEAKVLDYVFSGAAFTPPANLFVALYTATPTDAGGGTELTIGSLGYTRVSVTNNATNFPASTGTSPTTKSNGTAITFGTNTTTDWGTITAVALFDAASAGNMIAWTALTVSKPVMVGDTASFAIGALTFTLD
jgi:hypothetical protein